MSETPQHSLRPSKSQPPGPSRFLAALMVDPWFIVFRVIVVVVETTVKTILTFREKRKAARRARRAPKPPVAPDTDA